MISKILNDFSEVTSFFEAIIFYGSMAKTDGDDRSDIDICLVCDGRSDPNIALKRVWCKVNPERYDIRIFEELPLWLQILVIEEGLVIFAHDLPGLSEYLYFYRKLWDDQRRYQELERTGLYHDLIRSKTHVE